MAEKNYHHRDVVDKLGIKPGHAIAFVIEAGESDPMLYQQVVVQAGRPPATEDEAIDVALAWIDDTTDAIEVLMLSRC